MRSLLPVLLAHGGGAGTALLMLVSAGQPIFGEDTWLHLALGRVYAAQGPWLVADPLLHTAVEAPAPSAWLFGVALHGVLQLAGFHGLRVLHALAVACILVLAWTLLRRVSGSAALASLGSAVFVALSAYRLFQLRPHLATILLTLVLLHFVARLLAERDPPSWLRVAALAGGFALWANLHGGFVLGLVLLAAATCAQAALALRDPSRRPRARRLAAALACCALATLVNPEAAGPHGLYFAAGEDTPALGVVADEWAPVSLLKRPAPNVPPSPLAFGVVWVLLLATPLLCVQRLRRRPGEVAWVAIGAVSLVGLLSAVRLLWLGIAPLLLLGLALRDRAERPGVAWATGVTAVLLLPAFATWGDWPMISRAIRPESYAHPYVQGKHDLHAVWFLKDAGLSGNLWNDYRSGNFLGYWLAPDLEAFVNGSLNVPRNVMETRAAIRERRGLGERSFAQLLDDHEVDVFFGTGLPVASAGGRPGIYTTTHVETEPGWIQVFRGAHSAISLRRGDRNRENRARVAAYYADRGVPYDPESGFDPEAVYARAPRWAIEHGLVPVSHLRLETAARSLDPSVRGPADTQRAETRALLGLYARAAAVDRRRLARAPDALGVRRRLVWSLLRAERREEALEVARGLEAMARADALSGLLLDAAGRIAGLPEPEAASLLARLPLLAPAEVAQVGGRYLGGEIRIR